MLRQLSVEARQQLRTVGRESIAGGDIAVVEGHLEGRAGNETLVVGEVVFVCVLADGRRSGECRGRLRDGLPLKLDGSRKRGIERLRHWPRTVGGQRLASCTGAGAACGRTGSTWTTAPGNRLARVAQRVGHQTAADTEKKVRSRVCAQDIRIGNVQVEALDGDVVVILKRQQNGVAEAKVDFAVFDQIDEPDRVEEPGRLQ